MKLVKIVRSLIIGAVLSAGVAHAVVVNVDFGNGALYTGVGVAPDAGTTWNSGTVVSPATLVDSSGAATSVKMSVSGGQNEYDSGAVNALLNDYIFGNLGWGGAETTTVSLTGLAANQQFDLYAYAQGDNPDQNALVTLAAGNSGAFGTTPESDRTVMANTYLKLSGVADGSGNASFTITAAENDGGGFFATNGFQLDLNPVADTTPPTMVSFEHDKGAGPVLVNEPVTYTVTFSEPMSPPTVNAADFGNASATAMTINSVTPTANLAVFTVVATPSESGTLQLQINAGATLSDLAALPLDATNAIPDDIADILQVEDLPPTATTITVVSSGSPSTYGQNVTFTATVSGDPTGTPTSGTVQFYDGANYIGAEVAVIAGQASVSTNTLGAAPHAITAVYSGNFAFNTSTSASFEQVVDKAPLTVQALNALRAPNTANPDPLPHQITGFQNGENPSSVSGTPELTTTAVEASTVGDYPITCALGTLAADNYSFSFVHGTLTVADVANIFSVNFYMGPFTYGGLTTDEQKANVQIPAGVPAGLPGTWFTSGWSNFEVPWDPASPLAPVTLTSNKGAAATFTFKDCRNGGTFLNGPRSTLLGDGNGNMMDGHVTSTLDGDYKFDMEVTGIPFATYDVIFYLGGTQGYIGDRTGVIKFNGGAERAFTLKPGIFDGTFTEMTDATTQGNYIVFTGVTGSSFTTQTWGTGAPQWFEGPANFNHIGPYGFQIREAAAPANTFTAWANANNAAGQTPDQDHDNDGVPNGIEYFMGETGSSFTAMPGLDGSNTVTWPKNPDYQGTYEVQTSPDLGTWTNVDPRPVAVEGTLSYTLPPGLGKRFLRLLVTPAP